MSVFVLGPSLAIVEPEPSIPPPPAPAPPRVAVRFGTPPSEPGGIFTLELVANEDAAAVRPISLAVVCVTPPEAVPPEAERTPEWFLAQPVQATVPCDGDLFRVVVPGVVPGAHFVQTVIEYPS